MLVEMIEITEAEVPIILKCLVMIIVDTRH